MMGPVTMVRSVVKMTILAFLSVLDVIDLMVATMMKSSGLIGNDTQKFNLTIVFPNGQRHDVTVDRLEPKRIKLVLDIKETEENKFEVESKNSGQECTKEPSFLRPAWFALKTSVVILKITKFLRQKGMLLKALESRLYSYSMSRNGKDTENRKKISPRRRLPKSKVSFVGGLISKITSIVGISQKDRVFDPIVFDPVDGFDTSLNGSLNASRRKNEKRGHTSSSSESDYAESEEGHEQNEEVITAEKLVNGDTEKSPESNNDESSATECTIESGPENNKETNFSNSNIGAPLLKKNYFEEVEENYKSEEDPDYVPSQEASSESENDEETSRQLIEEAIEELGLPEAQAYLSVQESA